MQREFDDIDTPGSPFPPVDTWVVGAGPVGLALATALEHSGLQVLVVEGGGWQEDAQQESAMYGGEAAEPHPHPTEFRRQRFGGTSHLWGGRCVPLDPVDYAARPHVPLSGWPIGPSELEPHLDAACRWLDAGEANFSAASLADRRPLLPGLEAASDDLTERIERYSLPTDAGKAQRQRFVTSPSLHVLLNTRVIGLQVESEGETECVKGLTLFHTLTGRTRTVACRHVVICGGGLEATRLLLQTQRQRASWARFNTSLGRYYTCHFDVIGGELVVPGEPPPFEFERTRDGVYARRKLQLTQSLQSRMGLLNGTFRLHFPAYANPAHRSGVLSTIYLVKSILPGEHQKLLNHGAAVGTADPQRWRHLMNVAADVPGIARFAWDYLFRIKLATRKLPYTLVRNRNGSFPIEFNGEQVSHDRNRVTLLDQADPSGLPLIRIDWSLTDQDVDSAWRGFLELQRLIQSHTPARLKLNEAELRQQLAQALPVGGHHMGTTRMGADGGLHSVVNAHLQVHGVRNLSVCASSCMPTCGHANPTLTVVALAFRLAKHLSEQYAPPL